MDPFDEFEFKPLTDGLGFHKKAEKIKQDIKSTNLAQEKPSRAISESPRSLLHHAPSATSPMTSASSSLSSLLGDTETSFSARDTNARPASQSISDLIASLPPSLDFMEEEKDESISSSSSSSLSSKFGSAFSPTAEKSAFDGFESGDSVSGRPQIFHPLGREEYKAPSAPTVGSFLPTPGTKAGGSISPAVPTIPAPTTAKAPTPASPYRERLDESFARAFPHAEKSKREQTGEGVDDLQLQPVSMSVGAALLDGMVVAGISTILLVCILALTRINLIGMLTNAKTDVMTQVHLGLLVVAVLQMYMLVSRAFFGASLGEWAFDLQLGAPEDQRRLTYPLQVAWRSILVTFTGLIPLPLLSLIFRRDLLKYVTGLQLYRRQ